MPLTTALGKKTLKNDDEKLMVALGQSVPKSRRQEGKPDAGRRAALAAEKGEYDGRTAKSVTVDPLPDLRRQDQNESATRNLSRQLSALLPSLQKRSFGRCRTIQDGAKQIEPDALSGEPATPLGSRLSLSYSMDLTF